MREVPSWLSFQIMTFPFFKTALRPSNLTENTTRKTLEVLFCCLVSNWKRSLFLRYGFASHLSFWEMSSFFSLASHVHFVLCQNGFKDKSKRSGRRILRLGNELFVRKSRAPLLPHLQVSWSICLTSPNNFTSCSRVPPVELKSSQ